MNTEKYRKVTKVECDKFVKSHPNKLEFDVAGMYEPPLGTWNDFTNGKIWPESIVAAVKLYDGSDYHFGKEAEYYIKRE